MEWKFPNVLSPFVQMQGSKGINQTVLIFCDFFTNVLGVMTQQPFNFNFYSMQMNILSFSPIPKLLQMSHRDYCLCHVSFMTHISKSNISQNNKTQEAHVV